MSKLSLQFLTFTLFIYSTLANISDKRLCVDPECNSPVAFAKTLRRYFSPDKYKLSFGPNEDVVIFSKSAGSDENLWGAEINGKRGYIPKNLVRETRKIKQPDLLVDTEIINAPNKPQVPLKEEIVNPSKVKQSFEVIDGTTIYLPEQDAATEEKYTVEAPTQSLDSFKIDNIYSTEEIILSSENTKPTNSDSTEDSDDTNESKTENIVEAENSDSTNDFDKAKAENIETENAKFENFDSINDSNDTKADNIVETKISHHLNEGDSEAESSDVEVTTHNNNAILDVEENKINVNLFTDGQLEGKIEDIGSNDSLTPVIEIAEEISDKNTNEESTDSSEDKLKEINEKSDHIELKDLLSVSNSEEAKFEIDKDVSNFVDASDPSTIENGFQTDSHETPQSLEIDNAQFWNIEQKNENVVPIPDNIQSVHMISGNVSAGLNSDTIAKTSVNIESVSDSVQPFIEIENEVQTNISSPSENSKIDDALTEVEENGNTVLSLENIKSEELENSNNADIVEPDSGISSGNTEQNEELSCTDTGYVELPTKTDTHLPIENFPHNDINPNEQNSISSGNTEQNEELSRTDTVYVELPTKTDTHLPIENFPQNDIHPNEQNSIEKGQTNMVDSFNNQQMPNVNIHSAEGLLDHSNLQNDQEPNLQEKNAENKDNLKEETPTIFSYFAHNVDEHSDNKESQVMSNSEKLVDSNMNEEFVDQKNILRGDDFCTKEDCPSQIDPKSAEDFFLSMDILNFGSDIFLYLVTTAASVIIFLLGHFALDKSRREGPLIAKINKLEKELLIVLKEKEMLAEQIENGTLRDQCVESEGLLRSQEEKEALEEKLQFLEEQVQTLEKELENSTEVGLELNRMLSEVLNSENAGQTLMLNIEGLQAQLAEQQDIVSNMKEVLSLKETENHELNLELDIANKKVFDLQSELDKLLSNIIKLEEDRDSLEKNTESAAIKLKETINSLREQLENNQKEYIKNIEELNEDLSTSEHNLQLKTKEYEGLKNSMQQIKDMKNANTLESLLEVNSIKAELEQLKSECQGHCEKLRREKETNSILDKKVKFAEEKIDNIKTKFNETDKTKLELETKLQVLTNYFKEREEQLQTELSKYENMWSTHQGEATSTSERIKYLQSEVQNYKAQNETLKQEIVSQEVELKGQISVLEKKVHENWVSARQAERRLEELKQEAAQLRNRLTLRERALQEDRLHNRMQSPLEQGGDIPVSPLHLESPASPPLLYNSRDHITKSPPILGMPPPFLPPPSGSSYLPPPPLPFMPPPPHDMFPGDHRPPPLGRMSSPPLNSRYSPSRPYSPYDRSPSPSYDESEYGTSPVHRRNYSHFNRRREHRPAAMEKFNGRGGTLSSGSDNSNEFLDEINHQNSKV